MVRKLRNKFVITTMGLMLALFGVFIAVNTIYNEHWKNVEISEMLEWISYSGVFSTKEMDEAGEELIFEMTDGERPVMGIIVDNDGRTVAQKVVGSGEVPSVSRRTIDEMCRYRNRKQLVDGYYYSYTRLDESTILLVIMDSSMSSAEKWKILESVFLFIIGMVLLFFVTILLSHFVTKPAKNTLEKEKQFISDASHELRTPLGAICVNAQALEIENENNVHVKNIISESQRMGRLVERLLILSKLDEQEKVDFSALSISELFEEMALTYESNAFEKAVKYYYQVEPNLSIQGNADEIRQLLAILIDNALKNTEPEGVVRLRCNREGKHIKLCVTNTGKGIAEEDIPHIFERFYTSDNSRNRKSFGLGLAIAKSIVERHNGDIDVVSIPDKETTFKVTI